jgi:hypothetical protein
VRIGESTAIECLRRYVKVVCEVFGEQYLRPLNEDDTARLLNIAERRRFLGMLGSINCIHWKWKNYPTTWQGMYCGHVKKPTVILETVASHDLRIWHAFFGLPQVRTTISMFYIDIIFLTDLCKVKPQQWSTHLTDTITTLSS